MAREQVIKENMPLVYSIVKRFAGRGHEMEDLFQIGTIGLIKAIDKFDLSFDVKFSTYAVPMIMGEIKRFLRDDGMIKVSRTLKENGMKAKAAMERLTCRLGREPLLLEVAEESGLTVEEIAVALEAGAEVESIYKTIPQKDGSEICLLDRMESQNQGGGMQHLLNRVVLEQLLGELPDMERKLIVMRYMQDKTQLEVARVLGVSQVQVSRLEKRILKQMREKLVS